MAEGIQNVFQKIKLLQKLVKKRVLEERMIKKSDKIAL